jgi:hypothetical protein
MQSNRTRAAIALGAIVVAVVLFIVLQGGDNNDSGSQSAQQATSGQAGTSAADGIQSPKPPYVIVVRDGKPVGGIKKMEYKKDERIRFVVRSDVADEIHVHGYDRHADVSAGGSVRFEFQAKIEGVFVVELEQRAEQIAELRVNPS